MDINCTYNCRYQHDGKCNLSLSLAITNSKSHETDCPYYLPKDVTRRKTYKNTI